MEVSALEFPSSADPGEARKRSSVNLGQDLLPIFSSYRRALRSLAMAQWDVAVQRMHDNDATLTQLDLASATLAWMCLWLYP